MHPSALAGMRACIVEFMPADRHFRVVDFGSRMASDQQTPRDLLADRDCLILGVDIRPGRNVDLVYRLFPTEHRIFST